jgi:glycosyltransferase involved in cell wall biosynthesis
VDPVLVEACKIVEDVPIPPVGDSLAERAVHRLRLRLALLRGLPTWAAELRAPGFSARLRELLRAIDPDIVQLEYRIMAQFLPALAGTAPRVLVEYDPVRSDAAGVSALLVPLERRGWRRLLQLAARYADAIVVLTARDRALVEEETPSARVCCIPLGYDLPEAPLDPAGTRSEVVCVGSFIHPPNVEGARWLAQEVFPSVRRRIPFASLRLVGAQPSADVLTLKGDGVVIDPDVEDVWPFLDAAAVVAAPIRSGGGMRVKVLEALSGGKAVVATPLAVEGLDIQRGEQVVVAETAPEFAAALVDLLENRERRMAIATAAREWAVANLDLDQRVRAYETLYEELLR